MDGPIIWAMPHWLWLYSTVLSKAQSSSRSKEDPIALPTPKPPTRQKTKAPNPSLLALTLLLFAPCPDRNRLRGPIYPAKMGPIFGRHRQISIGKSIAAYYRTSAGQAPNKSANFMGRVQL